MDWKQFIASIVGALAWPGVIAFLLFLLRGQLVALAERIEEFTLPGGAQAKFAKTLEVVKEEAELLIEKDEAPGVEPENEWVRLAEISPEGAVIQAFNQIEKSLEALQKHLWPSDRRLSAYGTIRKLKGTHYIDEDVESLYKSLRKARNSAAHAEARVSESQAIDYAHQAALLNSIIQSSIRRREDTSEKGPAEAEP